jgi:hypothetical protein
MNVNKHTDSFKAQKPEFSVQKPFSVCFEHCSSHTIPTSKRQIKKVLDALVSFSNKDKHDARNPHPLDGSKKERLNNIITKYKETVYSLDVGHRNGEDGNYRLLYYRDPKDQSIAKIIHLFIDTH